MKKKFTISKKLFIGYGILAVAIVIFSGIVVFAMQWNISNVHTVNQVLIPSEKHIQDLKNNVEKSLFLTKSWVYIDKLPETPDKLKLVQVQDTVLPNILKSLEIISKEWNKEDIEKLHDIQKLLIDSLIPAQKLVMESLSTFESYEDAAAVFETQAAVGDGGDVAEFGKKTLNTIEVLNKKMRIVADEKSTEMNDLLSAIRLLFTISIFVLIAITIIVPLITARKIVTPVIQLQEVVLKMSTGHLPDKIEVKTGDEIEEMANALGVLLNELRKITSEIKFTSVNLDELSKNLTRRAEVISRGASEQAASVEQVAAGIEEMVANIEQNTDNANTATSIVREAVNKIKANNDNVGNTVNALQTILQKIQIIGDIAFQTNILSLNASIEAARAGKSGKGFGVVAAEVAHLADRSKESSEDIEELSDSSIRLAEETEIVSKALIPEISRTEELIRLVAVTGQELKNGVNQINDAINALNNITQQNAIFSDEMAQNSSDLAKQADKLVKMVEFFKT